MTSEYFGDATSQRYNGKRPSVESIEDTSPSPSDGSSTIDRVVIHKKEKVPSSSLQRPQSDPQIMTEASAAKIIVANKRAASTESAEIASPNRIHQNKRRKRKLR